MKDFFKLPPKNDFFAYHPEGKYSMLSTAHIVVIVVGIAAILLACFLLRKTEHKKIEKILFVFAIIGLIIDPLYWIWELIATHKIHFEKSLPLYFCSLYYITLAIAVFCKKSGIKQACYAYLATMNLIAGLMGLILNTNLNIWPVLSFAGIRTLVYHLMMIFVSCLLWFTKYYKPQIKDLYGFFIPIAIMFVPAITVNSIWGYDYCFLGGGKGTPILQDISAAMPLFAYIFILYVVIYIGIVAVFYIPTIVKYIKSKKSSTPPPTTDVSAT